MAAGMIAFGLLWYGARRGRKRAEADRSIALDTEREQITTLAVNAERTRILREMHDVIAHSLAIMIAQADGGAYVSTDAQAAKRAFNTISDTGRSALADTSRILGLLRAGSPDDPEMAPTTAKSIQALIAQTRAAGVEVSHIKVGEVLPLPSASALALFRVCQEALTNVLKHSGVGAQAVVTENWHADEVLLTISDQAGPDSAKNAKLADRQHRPGSGLIGMRERVESVGGSFDAEPITGGFRVHARIPFDPIGEL